MKKEYRFLVVCFFLSIRVPLFSYANQEEIEALEVELNAALTQVEMNILSGELASLWEEKLLKVEKEIASELDGDGLEFFLKASNAWRDYRKYQALYRGHFSEGGSIQALEENMNYINMTKERINLLSRKVAW